MIEEAGRYKPKEDYRMVTTHAHLIDKMYFFGKQKERYLRERDFINLIIIQLSPFPKFLNADIIS